MRRESLQTGKHKYYLFFVELEHLRVPVVNQQYSYILFFCFTYISPHKPYAYILSFRIPAFHSACVPQVLSAALPRKLREAFWPFLPPSPSPPSFPFPLLGGETRAPPEKSLSDSLSSSTPGVPRGGGSGGATPTRRAAPAPSPRSLR